MSEVDNDVNEQQEELDLEAYMQQGEEAEVEQEKSEPDYLSEIPDEDKKYAKGWNPDYKGENAKSLKQFIADGKMMEKIEYLSRKVKESDEEVKRRTQNAEKLYQVQIKMLEKQLKEAEDRLRDAVNMSDLDEVKEAQKEIAELEALKEAEVQAKEQVQAPYSPDDAEFLRNWDIQNQWFNADNVNHPNYDPRNPDIPKANYAKRVLAELTQAGYKPRELVSELERRVNEVFPVRQSKPSVPKHLPSQTMPGVKSGSRKLQWGELTRDELKIYESMSEAWGSKEEFLQAVQDDRNARSK